MRRLFDLEFSSYTWLHLVSILASRQFERLANVSEFPEFWHFLEFCFVDLQTRFIVITVITGITVISTEITLSFVQANCSSKSLYMFSYVLVT